MCVCIEIRVSGERPEGDSKVEILKMGTDK